MRWRDIAILRVVFCQLALLDPRGSMCEQPEVHGIRCVTVKGGGADRPAREFKHQHFSPR
jgi:hypothetical protein